MLHYRIVLVYRYATSLLLNLLVVVQAWWWLRQRHANLKVAVFVNPAWRDGGITGTSKFAVYETLRSVEGDMCMGLPPSFLLNHTEPKHKLFKQAKEFVSLQDNRYPVIAKPDRGARGVGAVLVMNDRGMWRVIKNMRVNYIVQTYVKPYVEVGIFFVRATQPDTPHYVAIGQKVPVGVQNAPAHVDLVGVHTRYLYKDISYLVQEPLYRCVTAIMDTLNLQVARLDVGAQTISDIQNCRTMVVYEVNIGLGAVALHAHDLSKTLKERYNILHTKWFQGLEHGLQHANDESSYDMRGLLSRLLKRAREIKHMKKMVH